MKTTTLSIALLILLLALTGCSDNDIYNSSTVGGAIMVTIRAEVIEIVSERALIVEVIEPNHTFDNDENALLTGVIATVIYGEDIDWISNVIDNEISIGQVIEFSHGITLGTPDFLQEPFEVRGFNIRVFDEDGESIFKRGF